MSLATKLKHLRDKKGQSLQQVAEGVGVSKVHYWELEKGTSTNPSLKLLKGISEYFSVPISFLLDDDVSPTEAEALKFFREFEGKLSEKEWAALRSMADALKSKDAE